MPENLSSNYQEIPPGCPAYNYDNPSPPFTPSQIAAIDSIKAFLSESELAQARRLETVYYSPVMKIAGGIFISGLRSYPTSFCLYFRRYDGSHFEDLLEDFLNAVYEGCPKESLRGGTWGQFRVTTPDGDRYYPFNFFGNLQAWKDRMFAAASKKATTMAWFERGKFCLTDGRRFAFGDLQIDRLKGGELIPQDW